jgi:hypothetical protein
MVKSLGRVRRGRVQAVTLRRYESYDACCASRIGERKGIRWLLPARGVALELKQVGVRPGQFTALVTLCLRALPLADSTWYVN